MLRISAESRRLETIVDLPLTPFTFFRFILQVLYKFDLKNYEQRGNIAYYHG